MPPEYLLTRFARAFLGLSLPVLFVNVSPDEVEDLLLFSGEGTLVTVLSFSISVHSYLSLGYLCCFALIFR